MNRAQRRIASGVNKRGLHKPNKGKLLVYGTSKWRQSQQTITLENGDKKVIKHVQQQ